MKTVRMRKIFVVLFCAFIVTSNAESKFPSKEHKEPTVEDVDYEKTSIAKFIVTIQYENVTKCVGLFITRRHVFAPLRCFYIEKKDPALKEPLFQKGQINKFKVVFASNYENTTESSVKISKIDFHLNEPPDGGLFEIVLLVEEHNIIDKSENSFPIIPKGSYRDVSIADLFTFGHIASPKGRKIMHFDDGPRILQKLNVPKQNDLKHCLTYDGKYIEINDTTHNCDKKLTGSPLIHKNTPIGFYISASNTGGKVDVTYGETENFGNYAREMIKHFVK